MGNFFKALEQAERERALKDHAQRAGAAEKVPVATAQLREAPPAVREVAPAAPPKVVTKATPAPSVFQRQTGNGVSPKPPAPPQISSAKPATAVESHLVSLLSPTSFGAEQYRALRHRVEQLHAAGNLSIVGVTSPEAGDGKTMTAINLAGALAQGQDARVLIVDADLRLSSMSEYLGLEGSRSRGLVGAILDHESTLQDAVEPCPPFNISIIRAGRRPTSPYELLKSPRLGQLLEEARQDYDYVVIDMPPLVPLLDCRVIGQWVDGFLVVVGAHKTPRKLVGEALKVLDPANMIGLIFNGDDQSPVGYYGRNGGEGTERRGWWGGRRHRRAPHEDAQ
jgi:capsular exopolysaccharide synthesis family protein